MKSPILWMGGKYFMCKHLMPLIPIHTTYVEIFGGGAQLLFAKTPSKVEIYNDIDSGLVNFFRVLRDKDKAEELKRLLLLTPYSRIEHKYYANRWQSETDDIQKAYGWFISLRMGFGAHMTSKSFGYSLVKNQASVYFNIIDSLDIISNRIRRVQIECLDFRKLIPQYDSPDTFFYCDPPYMIKDNHYDNNMDIKDHIDLVDILLGVSGKVILSGYENDVYSPLSESGWIKKEYSISLSSAGRTKNSKLQGEGGIINNNMYRTEVVWISPNALKHAGIFDYKQTEGIGS